MISEILSSITKIKNSVQFKGQISALPNHNKLRCLSNPDFGETERKLKNINGPHDAKERTVKRTLTRAIIRHKSSKSARRCIDKTWTISQTHLKYGCHVATDRDLARSETRLNMCMIDFRTNSPGLFQFWKIVIRNSIFRSVNGMSVWNSFPLFLGLQFTVYDFRARFLSVLTFDYPFENSSVIL